MSSSAAFLDRDGTIIVEVDYVGDPDKVVLLPGAAQAISSLKEAGYKVVIITNQSGIARGYFTLSDYYLVAQRTEDLLEVDGARVDATFFCPHHPDISGPCNCRKPALGMFEEAARELDIDLRRSFYIGDRVRDVEPALAVGGRGILVLTGYGEKEAPKLPAGIEIAADLTEAARRIVDGSSRL